MTKKPAASCRTHGMPGIPHAKGCPDAKAAPQSSPLPDIQLRSVDAHGLGGKDALTMVVEDRSGKYPVRSAVTYPVALIVRRVNQGPAFDALLDKVERAISGDCFCPKCGSDWFRTPDTRKVGPDDEVQCKTCEHRYLRSQDRFAELRAALKLAQEVR